MSKPLEGHVVATYVVPGLPHPLLAAEKSPAWTSLKENFARVRAEIEALDADLILYFSTQWLSVLGYLFQADPNPKWTHVDHNWHELGSMTYSMKVDTEFASVYAREVKALGHYVREVNHYGFPIDTGTVVAQAFLNPKNRLPAAMVSCNMYAEKQETLSIGQAGIRALQKSGKRAVVVCVSGLSSRFEVREIDPKQDRLSSLKDDEWNQKVLGLFAEGRLEDVSEVMREFSRQANADMGGRGIWWLNGLCGKHNEFTGKVFDYQPIWGTGAALVGLYPQRAIKADPSWRHDEADLVERNQMNTTASTEVDFVDKPVHTARAPEPVGPYPHARWSGGFLFLSGVGPRKPGTKEIPGVTFKAGLPNAEREIESYDVELQTRSVIENIQVILESEGLSLRDVIDVQVFLIDMKRDFAAFNRVYGEYFIESKPTRTTVEVGALPTPIAVELKVIARPKRDLNS